jgi:hypothetical protein
MPLQLLSTPSLQLSDAGVTSPAHADHVPDSPHARVPPTQGPTPAVCAAPL